MVLIIFTFNVNSRQTLRVKRRPFAKDLGVEMNITFLCFHGWISPDTKEFYV